MRTRLSLVLICLSTLLAGIAVQPASAAPVTVTGKCRLFGAKRFCIANVGNTIEVSAAASPFGGTLDQGNGAVYTAANINITLVASVNPQDWVFRTFDKGKTWTSIPQPGLPGLFNEGDVAIAPSGDLYISWYDLAREMSRLYVSHNPAEASPAVTESLLVGPEPNPDRPWVLASAPAAPGGPELSLSADNSDLITAWGSTDGGQTYLTLAQSSLINVQATGDHADPTIVPASMMDYQATSWGPSGSRWTPLPEGGFLSTDGGYWTTLGGFHILNVDSPLRELAATPWFKIASSGVVYQTRFTADGLGVEYRYLSNGVWSPFVQVATLSQPAKYPGSIAAAAGQPSVGADMAIQTHGDTLGINTRDGFRDILIRVDAATSGAPVVTRSDLGGSDFPLCDVTIRYDYPTLVFDRNGKAATSFCGGGVVQEAYEQ